MIVFIVKGVTVQDGRRFTRLAALQVSVRQVKLQHRVGADVFRPFQAVNRIGRLLLPQIDIRRQIEIPRVVRVGRQKRLQRFTRLVVFAGFHRLERLTILRGVFLTHVAFRQGIQQVAGELVTSGIVHPQRSHFRHVEILRRLDHDRAHLVGTVTRVRQTAFRQRVREQNFRWAGRITRLIEQFFEEARHGLRVKA